jgi:hypothetical protein
VGLALAPPAPASANPIVIPPLAATAILGGTAVRGVALGVANNERPHCGSGGAGGSRVFTRGTSCSGRYPTNARI